MWVFILFFHIFYYSLDFFLYLKHIIIKIGPTI